MFLDDPDEIDRTRFQKLCDEQEQSIQTSTDKDGNIIGTGPPDPFPALDSMGAEPWSEQSGEGGWPAVVTDTGALRLSMSS